MIHQLTEKIYNEIESKSVLVRNKMTINLQGEETGRIKTDLASRDGLEYNVEIKAEENHRIVKNNSDNTLICEICGNSYKSPTMLKTHLKSHTEAQCSLCQKVLKSSNLKTHLRKHTKPTNVYSVFKCNECDYKTGNKEDLKSHMYKTHMKIRPFICKICHKAFYSNKNLIEHCSTHNRDKNMVCDICGERFSYRKTLAYHMRSHLNQRSFICDVCGYIFLTISRRNEHVKRKHGPKQFCCNLLLGTYNMQMEESRTIQKSTQRKKLQNLLCSEQLCGLCFESDDGICIDVDLEIVGDEWSHHLKLAQVFNSIFHESIVGLASNIICSNCTNELIKTYKFIQNSKFTTKLIKSYVNDLESKTKDLFTHLKDTELESNIFIILENDDEDIASRTKTVTEENYKSLPVIDEEQESHHKTITNLQHSLAHNKIYSKSECRFCHIILPEREIKNHLTEVHEESVFICNICSEVYYTLSSLDKHAKITHADQTERFQCIMCLKEIEDSQDHICEFKCPECNDPSCIHFPYLIHYREQVLKESKPECLDCDFVCRKKESLIAHVNRYHLDHHPYTCDKCGQKFHSKTVLRAHIYSHYHNFTCKLCDLNLFSDSALTAHKYLCKDLKRKHACRESPANVDSTEELLQHGKLKHTQEISLCNKKSKSEYHTPRVHSKVHKKTANPVICEQKDEPKEVKKMSLHGPSKCLCKICNIEYDSLRKLGAHNLMHVEPFSTCHVCRKQIIQALFQKHIESHGVVSCNKCEKSFENTNLLKYHQKSHLDDVQCPQCNLTMNPGKLRRHVKSHVVNENPQLKMDKKQKPNIECELCEYITWNSILLECHMNRYHLKIKPYVCHICSKNFIGKHLLKKHLNYHTDNQSVICTICGKKLANSSCLKSHLKLHTGEKNYPCDVCGERFRSSSIMNVHKVKKHSERNAACPLCSSKFYTLGELRRHVIKTHWKKDTKFDPRELKGLENHYHLFHDGRRIRMDDHDVDFYMPC
ncbi:Uncharacterized protein OBRU01_03300 [Operophtera brumata]|uniref:C2H2-type domain-containing protein n=1 Tax=Operophtera brumata TaxID=104452 RepID=A0A0L7LPJ4_OPEBR|nr:Uncharacterized protein OBRU01_03300 [Operophtera brumata]